MPVAARRPLTAESCPPRPTSPPRLLVLREAGDGTGVMLHMAFAKGEGDTTHAMEFALTF